MKRNEASTIAREALQDSLSVKPFRVFNEKRANGWRSVKLSVGPYRAQWIKSDNLKHLTEALEAAGYEVKRAYVTNTYQDQLGIGYQMPFTHAGVRVVYK